MCALEVEPDALSANTQLQHVVLRGCYVPGVVLGAGVLQLLTQLQLLQQLTFLQFEERDMYRGGGDRQDNNRPRGCHMNQMPCACNQLWRPFS